MCAPVLKAVLIMSQRQSTNSVLSLLVCLLLAVAFHAQMVDESTSLFETAPRFEIGLNTIDSTYADLDGDGYLDLVAVNGGQANPAPTITVLFGKAGGRFGSSIELPTSTVPHTIAVGDMDDDGNVDIITASWYQNALEVCLNQGNRQFSAPIVTVPPDPAPGNRGEFFDLAIADFDGDMIKDVAALESQTGQRLRLFHFNADASLTLFATYDTVGSTNSLEGVIEGGDLNGDGLPDLVFAGGGPPGLRSISILYGRPRNGKLKLTTVYQNPSDQEFPIRDIAIADVDNDGDNDLVTVRGGIQVFRNVGNRTFTALPNMYIPDAFAAERITTGDYDKDTLQDVAVLQGSPFHRGIMVGIKHGRGDGTYVDGRYYSVASSHSIFTTDLDHDGTLDVLTSSSNLLEANYAAYAGVSNNTVNVLLNDNFLRFKAPLAVLGGPNFIDATDFNNDHYRDLASSWATGRTSTSGVDVLLNDKFSGLLPDVRYASPVALANMKTGDLTGDGNADAVTAHSGDSGGTLAVYVGNGEGGLASPVLTPIPANLITMVVGDFTGDHKDDVFMVETTGRSLCMISTGTGSFVAGAPVFLTITDPQGIVKGDFNSDQKLDLIVTVNGDLRLLTSDGSGGFLQALTSIQGMGNLAVGDLDRDGKLDVVGLGAPFLPIPPSRTDLSLRAYMGNGLGGFSGPFAKNIKNFSNATPQSMVAADFDLDGFDDVAIGWPGNTFGNLVIVHSSGVTPGWTEPAFPAAGTATRTLIAGDFNGDGKADIGYVGDTTRGVIYNKTGIRRPGSMFDYDGDGMTDMSIFRADATGVWYVYQSTAGVFGENFGTTGDRMVPADYDGDRRTDIAVYRPSTGYWHIFNSSTRLITNTLFGGPTDIPMPADYDGDGKADIALFRPAQGTWHLVRSTAGPITFPFGQGSDIPVMGDYDGDGKADCALFRPSTAGWHIKRSTAGDTVIGFGYGTDKPVPADYDGDGRTDLALFRPSTGEWFIANSATHTFPFHQFGTATDIPVPGDYDGDGRADVSIFRNSDRHWWMKRTTAGLLAFPFGESGDKPTPSAFLN